MIKNSMASRLLPNDLNLREQVVARIKLMMEDVDMAIHGRGSGLGFVYNNIGDLLKRVNHVGIKSQEAPVLSSPRLIQKQEGRNTMNQLKSNVERLHEMQSRLEFMLTELEGIVKKG